MHAHTCTHTLTHAIIHTRQMFVPITWLSFTIFCYPRIYTHTLALTHTLHFTLSKTHTCAHTYFLLSLPSHSLSQSHTCRLCLSHPHAHTHTLARTHALTLARTLMNSLTFGSFSFILFQPQIFGAITELTTSLNFLSGYKCGFKVFLIYFLGSSSQMWTQDVWVGSTNATTVLCHPPPSFMKQNLSSIIYVLYRPHKITEWQY